jgi:hypothetical protein
MRTALPAEAVAVRCAACGRPFGHLAPLPGDPSVIRWAWERTPTRDRPAAWSTHQDSDANLQQLVQREGVSPVGRQRGWCVRRCGAAPVYTQATIAEQYRAAKAAGVAYVRL